MYGPLLARWNMLVLDNRGTGESTPIDCPALQSFSGPTGTEAFQSAAGACAASLNRRWRYPGAGFVHASDLFSSAPAAEDLAELIRALDLGAVDLYGDSYGSFFAQAFASRYPALLRSVILDSTYQTKELDPSYRSSIESMPGAFDAVCERWGPCAEASPERAWETIEALAARLRTKPVSGFVPGPSGSQEEVSMNVVGLVDLVNDAAEDPQMYRDLDAAARALLLARDAAPLLRLYAQRLAVDEAYFGEPPSEYSVGLYLADSCVDYPQLFSMQSAPSVRTQELSLAEQALPGSTFAPFSTAEWLAQDENTEAYSACLQWPAPTIAQPPTLGSPPLLPASLPVLVLGGELDTWTPPAGVGSVLAQIGGHARFVELANATHVVGEGDISCGSTLVREFVEDPAGIDSLNISCAPAVAPIHAVGVYPVRLSEEQPLQASPGSVGSSTALRLAAAAVQTAGDALARYQATEARLDHGLEGGSVSAAREGALLTLTRDRLIAGVPVSGSVSVTPPREPLEGLEATARLTARSGGSLVRLTASWSTQGAAARAQVVGTFTRVVGAVRPVALSGAMPAP
jgi:pimeloyl-ACP methyl ester carboxylesterase